MWLLISLVLLLTPAVTMAQGSCENSMDWKYFGGTGHYYRVNDCRFAWEEARVSSLNIAPVCPNISQRTYLATILSRAEQDFISETFEARLADEQGAHLGLKQEPPAPEVDYDRNWFWITGEGSLDEPNAFVFWHAAEPNQAGGRQDCGLMFGGNSNVPDAYGFWDDIWCTAEEQARFFPQLEELELLDVERPNVIIDGCDTGVLDFINVPTCSFTIQTAVETCQGRGVTSNACMSSFLAELRENNAITQAEEANIWFCWQGGTAGETCSNPEWNYYSGTGHYYRANRCYNHWEGARVSAANTDPVCPNLDGVTQTVYLATLLDAEEQAFVESLQFNDKAFIGLRQNPPFPEIDPASDWAWITGEATLDDPGAFINWSGQNPDNLSGGTQHCGMLWASPPERYGQWDDDSCSYPFPLQIEEMELHAPNVVIDGCDTGVPDLVDANTCSLLIADALVGCLRSRDSCFPTFLTELTNQGRITAEQEAAILFCFGGGVASQACDYPVWNYYSGTGHYYRINNCGHSWEAARVSAANTEPVCPNIANATQSVYLATILNAGEQAFIETTMDLNATEFISIGLRQNPPSPEIDAGKDWFWITGEGTNLDVSSATYNNWDAGQPDNCCSGSSQDCAVMFGESSSGSSGSWGDVVCASVVGRSTSQLEEMEVAMDRPNVIIDGCDSGVKDILDTSSCSFMIADAVTSCDPSDDGCLPLFLESLKIASIITAQQEAAILFCHQGGVSSETCDYPEWRFFGGTGHYYRVNNCNRVDWAVARVAAANTEPVCPSIPQEAYLATILDQSEQDFVELFQGQLPGPGAFFGLRQSPPTPETHSDKDWSWITGEGSLDSAGAFTNWDINEPNELGDQDCGVVNGFNERFGSWDDVQCVQAPFRFVELVELELDIERPHVVINGCDSGVQDFIDTNTCSFAISGAIADCVGSGDSSCLPSFLAALKDAGAITGEQEVAIRFCFDGGVATQNCDEPAWNFYSGTGHYYRVNNCRHNWVSARISAALTAPVCPNLATVSQTVYLATILDQAEQDFIETLYLDVAEFVAIGLKQNPPNPEIDVDKGFSWITGEGTNLDNEYLTYNNWGEGQPNDCCPSPQECTAMFAAGSSRRGQWADIECFAGRVFAQLEEMEFDVPNVVINGCDSGIEDKFDFASCTLAVEPALAACGDLGSCFDSTLLNLKNSGQISNDEEEALLFCLADGFTLRRIGDVTAALDGNDDGVLVTLNYEIYRGRTPLVSLYQSDCSTPLVAPTDISSFTNLTYSNSTAFFHVDELILQISLYDDASFSWESLDPFDDDRLSFCVRVELEERRVSLDSTISYHSEVVVTLDVNQGASNPSVAVVEVEDSMETETIMATSYEVSSCLCDADNLCTPDATPVSPDSYIRLCVSTDSSFVDVSGVSSLILGEASVAVDEEHGPNILTQVQVVDGTAVVTTRFIYGFFERVSGQVTVGGTVALASSSPSPGDPSQSRTEDIFMTLQLEDIPGENSSGASAFKEISSGATAIFIVLSMVCSL